MHTITDIMLPVATLQPYERNARQHPESQIADIVKSMQRFGFTNPCVVDESDMILAGHGRVIAAQRCGIEQAPCRKITGLSEDEKRALVIWDNKSALNASWDIDMLGDELAIIKAAGLLEFTGFSDEELSVIAEGWTSDLNVQDKHGESLDGVSSVVRVRVDPDEEQNAKDIISAALEAGGVTYAIMS